MEKPFMSRCIEEEKMFQLDERVRAEIAALTEVAGQWVH